MNSQIKRILKWAFWIGVLAFLTNFFLISSDQILSIRICFGLMVAGAGAVTGALLCANFTADADEPLEGEASDHASGATPGAAPGAASGHEPHHV